MNQSITFYKKPDASRRMIKWVIKLSEVRINFALKSGIKGHALVDLIIDNLRNILIETRSEEPQSEAKT